MSRGYGWRGGCSAADVPDVGVGSVEWFGLWLCRLAGNIQREIRANRSVPNQAQKIWARCSDEGGFHKPASVKIRRPATKNVQMNIPAETRFAHEASFVSSDG